jgi:hypothetical protein
MHRVRPVEDQSDDSRGHPILQTMDPFGTIGWDNAGSGGSGPPPSYVPASATSPGQARVNTVTETVKYHWVPGIFFSPIYSSCTYVMPMSY